MYTPCFEAPEIWLSTTQKKIAQAKAGCARCPITEQCLRECLEYEALAGTTKIGVHGGLTPAERTNLPKG
jgi:hypothetical protein